MRISVEDLNTYFADLALDAVEDLRILEAQTGIPYTYDDALEQMWRKLAPSLKAAFKDYPEFTHFAAPLMKSIKTNVFGGDAQ